MSKIYDLYPKEQRKIDNQARRIRGYEKMKNDLTNVNKRLNRENKQLKQRIDEALDYINEKAPKVSTLILDTENKVKLLAKLKGADEKQLLKAVLKGSEDNE